MVEQLPGKHKTLSSNPSTANDSSNNNNIFILLPGMVVHSCNPRFRKLRQEDHESKASLDYIAML
jgi:hypothetical protein